MDFKVALAAIAGFMTALFVDALVDSARHLRESDRLIRSELCDVRVAVECERCKKE